MREPALDRANLPAQRGRRRPETGKELLARLDALVRENRRLADLYWQAEKRHGSLMGLYVAALRLHASLERSELLLALHEVLGSLIGCERAAVYQVEAGGLKPVALLGVGADQAPELQIGQGPVGRAVQSGQVYISSEATLREGVSACAPLVLDGVVTGAIVLFGLLPQKAALDEHDRELLELLSTHAALALQAAASRRAEA